LRATPSPAVELSQCSQRRFRERSLPDTIAISPPARRIIIRRHADFADVALFRSYFRRAFFFFF